MTYTVIYEQGPASWGAYLPDLPGVIALGDSREEAEILIREAIHFHIEGLVEEGLPVPKPTSWAATIDVAADKLEAAKNHLGTILVRVRRARSVVR